MVIWKATIPIDKGTCEVSMPEGARPLSVQMQHRMPRLWFLCNPDAPIEKRTVRWFGTGHDAQAAKELGFLGTVQLHNGNLVFHAFID